MFQQWFRLNTLVIILPIIFIFTAPASAEEASFRAKTGLYISIGGANNTVKGDFNGDTIFTGSSDVLLVPKVDGGKGLKIALGSRSSGSAFEVSYIQSDHDITFSGATGEAELKIYRACKVNCVTVH